MEVVQDIELDLVAFIPNRYYCFKYELREYLILWLKENVTTTMNETIIGLDVNFFH